MNKIIILLVSLCCVLSSMRVKASEEPLNSSDANLIGHVLDKKTQEHLAFINVFIVGTTIGTTTDNTGHYFLKNLPEGEFKVEFKTLGYKTVVKTVQLKKGKTIELNIEMEEDQIALDGAQNIPGGDLGGGAGQTIPALAAPDAGHQARPGQRGDDLLQILLADLLAFAHAFQG